MPYGKFGPQCVYLPNLSASILQKVLKMSPTPPPPPPPAPAHSHNPSARPHVNPPAPVVYALPPKGPGIIRSAFSGLMRFIMLFVLLIFAFGLLAGLIQMSISAGDGPRAAIWQDGDAFNQVAILDLKGAIGSDTAEYIHGAVDFILDSPEIKAVVFRVDSPGGGVTASDHIWYEINRLKAANLPVIASYGSVSASGGVYASCHSDYIFAEPTTITGSIGVIAQVLTFGELLEKVGVDPVTMVATGSPEKDVANDTYRTWTDADISKIQKILDASYGTFFNRVWDGRKHVIPNEDDLRALANGSIFTAQEAVDNKLVDAIGYLDEAVSHAVTQANLPHDAMVVRLQPWSSGLPFPLSMQQRAAQLFGATTDNATSSNIFAPGGPIDPEAARLWLHEVTRPQAMYLMDGR